MLGSAFRGVGHQKVVKRGFDCGVEDVGRLEKLRRAAGLPRKIGCASQTYLGTLRSALEKGEELSCARDRFEIGGREKNGLHFQRRAGRKPLAL